MSKIILQDVRGSYVFVNEQRKSNEDGSPGGYGMQILVEKGSEQHKKMMKIVDQVLVNKFGQDALKKKARFKLPLRDGDEERDGEEYENMIFFNANSKFKKPGIVNRNNEPADQDDIDDYCYSGAYFHASVSFYAFDAKSGGKPGVAVGLNNIMLRCKGDRLDGSVSATSEFSNFTDLSDDFDKDIIF
jgi:hypothetical protein